MILVRDEEGVKRYYMGFEKGAPRTSSKGHAVKLDEHTADTVLRQLTGLGFDGFQKEAETNAS